MLAPVVLAFYVLVHSVLCTCCGRSRVYMHESSERSPPHLVLYLVLIQKQKYGNKLIALPVLRNRELLKYIEKTFNLTMILTQARLNQDCISMSMPCNINPKPWLTFPFEFSSLTHPIGFGDFCRG